MDFWVPLITGIFLIVVGGAGTIEYLRFRRRAERVPGIVADMREHTGTECEISYYPVLEFTTRSGSQIRTASRLGSYPAHARIGDQVTVLYDPHNPEKAEIAGKGWLRLLVLLLLVPGGIFSMWLAWM